MAAAIGQDLDELHCKVLHLENIGLVRSGGKRSGRGMRPVALIMG